MNLDFSKFPQFDDHEAVVFVSDAEIGLRGFIAIHNSNLGPATGGTRYWNYRSEGDALRDVLRLSQAMTYKCALARVPHGGGKGVIIANSHHPRKKQLVAAYAKRINLLNGNFITGEDVGINEDDVRVMLKHTSFIIGKPNVAGDPSPWAALGVFYAMQGALEKVLGSAGVHGRTVAVKGIGKVGFALCGLLYKSGARLVVADIDSSRIRLARREFPGVKVVSPPEIHRQKVDVYAPCALGDEFNKKTIPQLRCGIICGGANNQLASPEDGFRLHSWGILYVPDYLANAGGLINVAAELDKRGYSRRRVVRKVRGIRNTTKKIIQLSRKQNKPTSEIADRLAESIFRFRKRAARR